MSIGFSGRGAENPRGVDRAPRRRRFLMDDVVDIIFAGAVIGALPNVTLLVRRALVDVGNGENFEDSLSRDRRARLSGTGVLRGVRPRADPPPIEDITLLRRRD